MAKRIKCVVPFCRCSTGMLPVGTLEWICRNHWRLISRKGKARLRRAQTRRDMAMRSLRHATDLNEASLGAGMRAIWAQRLYARLWERCKATAIERAAGIAA